MSEPSDTISLPMPDDFHVHLRQGPTMPAYLRREARWFGRVMVMPNTVPTICSGPGIEAYRRDLREALGEPQLQLEFRDDDSDSDRETGTATDFGLLMTFKILPGMNARTIAECREAGAIAGKYYPAGATTNSADGLARPELAEEALEAMEEEGLPLSIHAEDPLAPVFEREEAFLPILEDILRRHPRLWIVFEHISSAAGLAFVLSGPERLSGTVTAHHLLFSVDDMMGEVMNPHLYCKPVIKGKRDRDALRSAVFAGNPKLFFGSDSAPHSRAAKEGGRAASGVYSAPTAVPALAGLFEREGELAALPGFLAGRGAAFYGLPAPRGSLILVRRPWTVPAETDGVVPMCAGMTLGWDKA